MNLNELNMIIEALEKLSAALNTTPEDILDCLRAIEISDEDANRVLEAMK